MPVGLYDAQKICSLPWALFLEEVIRDLIFFMADQRRHNLLPPQFGVIVALNEKLQLNLSILAMHSPLMFSRTETA